jgi:hypothetical protein
MRPIGMGRIIKNSRNNINNNDNNNNNNNNNKEKLRQKCSPRYLFSKFPSALFHSCVSIDKSSPDEPQSRNSYWLSIWVSILSSEQKADLNRKEVKERNEIIKL